MKKAILVLLCGSITIVACNSGGSAASKADSASTAVKAAPAPEASTASEKGLELIGASDCTTCHRLHKTSPGATIGPAYSDVAAKYAPAADSTVNRLIHKIKTGGSGVWGTVPMTPHPALQDSDLKVMVTYILSLKN
jgi:cytochrome c